MFLKMWRKNIFIRHKCDERKNNVGRRRYRNISRNRDLAGDVAADADALRDVDHAVGLSSSTNDSCFKFVKPA